jgi:co-chaperonin GroES (HSP10)
MIEVLGHRLLIKPKEVETVSKGGIVMAVDVKAERTATQEGTVIQVGPNAFSIDALGGVPWVSPGDEVIFARYAGKQVRDPETNEEYFVINDEDVQCRTKRAA